MDERGMKGILLGAAAAVCAGIVFGAIKLGKKKKKCRMSLNEYYGGPNFTVFCCGDDVGKKAPEEKISKSDSAKENEGSGKTGFESDDELEKEIFGSEEEE